MRIAWKPLSANGNKVNAIQYRVQDHITYGLTVYLCWCVMVTPNGDDRCEGPCNNDTIRRPLSVKAGKKSTEGQPTHTNPTSKCRNNHRSSSRRKPLQCARKYINIQRCIQRHSNWPSGSMAMDVEWPSHTRVYTKWHIIQHFSSAWIFSFRSFVHRGGGVVVLLPRSATQFNSFIWMSSPFRLDIEIVLNDCLRCFCNFVFGCGNRWNPQSVFQRLYWFRQG